MDLLLIISVLLGFIAAIGLIGSYVYAFFAPENTIPWARVTAMAHSSMGLLFLSIAMFSLYLFVLGT